MEEASKSLAQQLEAYDALRALSARQEEELVRAAAAQEKLEDDRGLLKEAQR